MMWINQEKTFLYLPRGVYPVGKIEDKHPSSLKLKSFLYTGALLKISFLHAILILDSSKNIENLHKGNFRKRKKRFGKYPFPSTEVDFFNMPASSDRIWAAGFLEPVKTKIKKSGATHYTK